MAKSSIPFVFPDPAKPFLVWWTCKIEVPKDDGTREAQDLKVQFCIIPNDELQKLTLEGGAQKTFERIVVDWLALDDKKKSVPFARFKEVAALPFVEDGILRGYREACGRGPAKN